MNAIVEHGLILFGHGARDPQWAQPMQSLQQRLAQLLPTTRCELAFLELMPPDLPSCVQTLVEDGCTVIHIVPIFFGQGGHLKKDFPLLLQTLKSRYPNIAITAHSHVGQWEAVWETIALEVKGLLRF